MARVVIPVNVAELIELCNLIIEKEDSLAPNGTLTPAELTDLKNLRDVAQKTDKAQAKLHRDAEEETAKRNNALGITDGMSVDQPGSVLYLVTMLRDLLLGRNKINPKVLGEWGFEVDESPKSGGTPPAPPTP